MVYRKISPAYREISQHNQICYTWWYTILNKSYCNFLLKTHSVCSIHSEKKHEILIGSWTETQTALMTDTTSVLSVQWLSPSRPFNCCSPLTMEAPPMNPLIAERESTRKPNLKKDRCKRLISESKESRLIVITRLQRLYLNRRNVDWKIPVKNVTVKTVFPIGSRIWSMFGSAILWAIDESKSDTMAIGPMAISLEVPITAYTRGGTTLVSYYKQQNHYLAFSPKQAVLDWSLNQ